MPREPAGRGRIEVRVIAVAETAIADHGYVTPIEVLEGLGWLPGVRVDEWRQGRVDYLERGVQANLSKVSTAMGVLRRWAESRGLKPSETAYVARTRDRRNLRFSKSGDPSIEVAYRTHWVSPELSARRQKQLAERNSKPPDLVVVSAIRDWTCTECSCTDETLLLMEEPGPLCMRCADLDHLVYLPSGDAALTRRARKASGLTAVAVRFSRARRRYERQGILVEEAALEQAEASCLADADARLRRRERDEERRAHQDFDLQQRFEKEIAALFPGCPPERAQSIARHTAIRGSGRVGRSAAGRALEQDAIELAVAASVRHTDTGYDELLMCGMERAEARSQVRPEVDRILDEWRGPDNLQPATE